jgi:SH3-like domain-containing protein
MADRELARVTRDYKAQYQSPISVAARESVQLGERDDEYPEWQWCRSDAGREGWMPVSLLVPTAPGQAMVTEDYDATELSVIAGETVQIKRRIGQWARVINASGAIGWVPEDVLGS